MLAKSKFSNIETLVSKALTDIKISNEEFITILKEKNKYETTKENVRSVNEKLVEKERNNLIEEGKKDWCQ